MKRRLLAIQTMFDRNLKGLYIIDHRKQDYCNRFQRTETHSHEKESKLKDFRLIGPSTEKRYAQERMPKFFGFFLLFAKCELLLETLIK